MNYTCFPVPITVPHDLFDRRRLQIAIHRNQIRIVLT